MNPTDPTQQQLAARLNPTATQVSTPSQGLFRGVGDYGTTLYQDLGNGKVKTYDILDAGRKQFMQGKTADQYGNYAGMPNAGGQADLGLQYIKNKYGIDYNALPQVNIGDYFQSLSRQGYGTTDVNGGYQAPIIRGNIDELATQSQNAQLSSQAINTQKNVLGVPPATLASANANGFNTPVGTYKAGDLTNFLTGGKSGIVDNATLNQLAQSVGIQGYQNNPTYNAQLLQKLQAMRGTGFQPTPAQGAPAVLNPNAPVNIPTSSTYPSSAITGSGTADVMNARQSYEDTINNYLSQIANAQSALNQTQATQLQGTANIMYGLNGTGGHDANLQGAEQQMFDRQMAFQTVPAQIQLQNAQTALNLFKQTPAYLNETQARDTAFNLLQSYPDINYQYNPSISAQANLQAIKSALTTSPKYQASLVSYKGYMDANGVFHLYNSKDISGTPTGVNTPTGSNPVTPAGTYLGTGTTSINQFAPIDEPKTKTQVDFVNKWNGGDIGNSKNALNTAIGHLFEADQLFPALGNTNNTVWNATKNAYAKVTGSNAPTDYENAQTLASNELASAYGGNSQADREKLSQFGGSQQSPSQHNGYIETATKLLASKIGAMADQYRSAFGHYPPSLDALILPLNQIKLAAFTKINLNGIIPGMSVSPSTQALMNTAQIVGGKVYLPDANGNYQPQS